MSLSEIERAYELAKARNRALSALRGIHITKLGEENAQWLRDWESRIAAKRARMEALKAHTEALFAEVDAESARINAFLATL